MLRILCVCVNGMGTSTILKVMMNQICDKIKLDGEVESCSAGEANAYLMQTDLVITTPELAEMLIIQPGCVLKTTNNLMDEALLESLIKEACVESFPTELPK